MYVRMAGQPPVMLGLVGVEVIQDHVKLFVNVVNNDTVHKVQELPATAALIVSGPHQPGGHLQGGKQRGRTVVRPRADTRG